MASNKEKKGILKDMVRPMKMKLPEMPMKMPKSIPMPKQPSMMPKPMMDQLPLKMRQKKEKMMPKGGGGDHPGNWVDKTESIIPPQIKERMRRQKNLV